MPGRQAGHLLQYKCEYNAESPRKGRKRLYSIAKTIHFSYLPIIYLWPFLRVTEKNVGRLYITVPPYTEYQKRRDIWPNIYPLFNTGKEIWLLQENAEIKLGYLANPFLVQFSDITVCKTLEYIQMRIARITHACDNSEILRRIPALI